MNARIEKLRARIARIKAEEQRVDAATLDDTGIGRQVDQWVTKQVTIAEDKFFTQGFELAHEPKYPGSSLWPGLREVLKHDPEVALAVTVYLNQEAVKERLFQAVKAGAGDNQVADKASALQALRAERYQLECDEEAEICKLEEQGVEVFRRGDMDPRAILGLPA